MGIDISQLSPQAQRQILEKLGKKVSETDLCKPAKPERKYRNEPDMRAALRFDSKREARRFDELRLMLVSGAIEDLRLQRQFTLQESYITPEGQRIRAIRYVADFTYKQRRTDGSEELIVEDVKSSATANSDKYKLKKKLMQERFGITIREV